MAYVYQHKRKDNGEVFYVGIGNDSYYRRANQRIGRNPFWKRIVQKTEYEVIISVDNISWEEACKEEIKQIAEIGRRDRGRGTLCNLSDGGDGAKGQGVVFLCFSKQGDFIKEYDSISDIETDLGISNTSVYKCCRLYYVHAGGYIFRIKSPDDIWDKERILKFISEKKELRRRAAFNNGKATQEKFKLLKSQGYVITRNKGGGRKPHRTPR